MRITTALGFSLLLHLAMALVPSGHILLVTKPGDAASEGNPAPLWVDLGPSNPDPVLLPKTAPPRGPSPLTSHRTPGSASILANNEQLPPKIALQEETATTGTLGSKPGLLDPHYFPSAEVTIPARIISGYAGLPEDLTRDVASGRMIILILVSEQGAVDKLLVEQNDIRADVEAAIVGHLQSLKFSPAIKGEQPVKSRMRMEITLQPPRPFMPPDRTSARGN